MTRRRMLAKSSVATQKKVTTAGVHRALTRKWHWHACIECPDQYACTCEDPALNGRCQPCRTEGRLSAPPWDKARRPSDCCVNNTVQLTKNEDLVRYELAGPGPWFQCKKCFRSHPKPTTERNAP